MQLKMTDRLPKYYLIKTFHGGSHLKNQKSYPTYEKVDFFNVFHFNIPEGRKRRGGQREDLSKNILDSPYSEIYMTLFKRVKLDQETIKIKKKICDWDCCCIIF